MTVTIKWSGLRELERALTELPKATAKNTVRRVSKKALEPFLASVKAKAPTGDPVDTPQRPPNMLRDSYLIGTKLTPSQAKKARREGKHFTEVYAGTADPIGIFQEFGTVNHPPQPHARPAWDETKDEALVIFSNDLGGEIEKAANRLAKKRARR